MIKYIKGDATQPIGEDNKIIVHCCNDIGGWGRGFVLAISNVWKEPEQEYRIWYKTNKPVEFRLGNVIFVQVEDDVWVANLIGQRHIQWKDGIPPIRYKAIEDGLMKVAKFAEQKSASIHMPRMGSDLAGGEWSRISEIIDKTLSSKGIEVTVYDLK